MTHLLQLYKNRKFQLYGLAVLSVLALAMPFVHYSLGWFTPICLLPFLFLLQFLKKQKDIKRTGLVVWLVGFGSFLIILSWCAQTSPEKWAFITGFWAIVALWFTYIGFAALFSLQYVIFWQLYTRLQLDLMKSSLLILFPAIWVVSEFARSLLFSILLAGKGSSVGFYWNFGMLGVAGAVTPMGYMARVVGLAGLSFAIVALNVGIFMLLKQRWRLALVVVAITAGVTIIGWLAYSKNFSQGLEVSVLQLSGELADSSGSDFYAKIGQITQNVYSAAPAQILILPEYSNFFVNAESLPQAVSLTKRLAVDSAPIITSIDKTQPEGVSYNRLVVYDNNGNEITAQDKSFLIPIGEYMPYLYQWLLSVFGQNFTLEKNAESREVTKSASLPTSILVNGLRLGAQACSGAIAPELYRSQVRDGAVILTNSANLGIFTKATLYHQQSRQFARFIAIANNRAYLQSASGGYSYIIDSNGNFIAQSTTLDNDFLNAQIGLSSQRTLYSVLGEYWLAVSIMIITVFGVTLFVRKKQKNISK